MTETAAIPALMDDQRRELMKAPDDVSAMLRLKALGWGSKRIAAELGCSRNTVRRWLAEGEWHACASPSRSKRLDGLSGWLGERFARHAGNADVVRQELAAEKGLVVSLRTVERAVAPLRRDLIAAARATVRFETQPGEQLQIDFGVRRVPIGDNPVKVFLFVATLGYSRRLHVRAYGHEKQDSWFDGMESAFRAFGGVPREVLLDNARALILHHNPTPVASDGACAALCSSCHRRNLGCTFRLILAGRCRVCWLSAGDHGAALPAFCGGALAQRRQGAEDVRSWGRERVPAPALARDGRQTRVPRMRLHDLLPVPAIVRSPKGSSGIKRTI
jgi:transposase